MAKLFSKIGIGIVTSMFLFPFGFTFLPAELSTKIILAIIGVIMYLLNCVEKKGVNVTIGFLGAICLAVLFSGVCYYSAEYNGTTDYSYATYFASFFVWMAAAYTVARLIGKFHGESNLKYLTYYLTGVSVVQCILAILFDRVPSVGNAVSVYIQMGQNFYQDIGRLYGIGAALDPAGVRFSVVLILITAILSYDASVRTNKKVIIQLLISYFIVVVIGNMIARTTSVGVALSVALAILGTQAISLTIKSKYFKVYSTFAALLVIAIFITTYLYNTNASFHDNLRYAFEGFFNWAETGVWRTNSTDILQNVMWIWPTDTKTWIIGSGYFGNYIYSTDIGYCRFILYCGIVGFSVFALLFVYSGLYFTSREKEYRLLFLFLIATTFIIWSKVATDIFQFYALFYCLDSIRTLQPNENRILHS